VGLLDLATVPPGSDRKLAALFLRPIDANTGQPTEGMSPMKLQFWPESISYSRGSVGWQSRAVPGLSHNLFSWTGGESPTLTFDIVLVNERDPSFRPNSSDSGILKSEYNFDANITAGLAWFAAAGNPLYAGVDEPVQPPPMIQVIAQHLTPQFGQSVGSIADSFGLGGSPLKPDPSTTLSSDIEVSTRFSHLPDRDFIGVLMDWGVNYEKFYPSGTPRIAVVNLSFSEVIQIGDAILPHSRSQNLQIAKHFELTPGANWSAAVRGSR
jgi:hypothetical protein